MSILSGERLTSWLRLDWFRLPPMAGRRGFRCNGMLVGDGWDCDCEGALEPPSSGDNNLLMSMLLMLAGTEADTGQPYGYSQEALSSLKAHYTPQNGPWSRECGPSTPDSSWMRWWMMAWRRARREVSRVVVNGRATG